MQTPAMNPSFSDMQVAGICKMCALESGAAQAIAAYRERLIAARDAEWQARVDELEAEAREPVRWFAAQMERKLKEHDQDRGIRGWIGPTCDPAYLMERLMEEAEEYRDTPSNDIQAKIDELADIANFAMMLADRLRAALGREA